jgi:hypothetical protein
MVVDQMQQDQQIPAVVAAVDRVLLLVDSTAAPES